MIVVCEMQNLDNLVALRHLNDREMAGVWMAWTQSSSLTTSKKTTPLFSSAVCTAFQVMTYIMICWSVLKRKKEQAKVNDAAGKEESFRRNSAKRL